MNGLAWGVVIGGKTTGGMAYTVQTERFREVKR